MSSKAEIGISPVLLQAISQTLSSKAVQRPQSVLKDSHQIEQKREQQDAVSVPAAEEQVTSGTFAKFQQKL